MQRFRTIAGPPQRTATAAWQTVSELVTDTLTASAAINGDAVAVALTPLHGIGPALIAAGHLEAAPMVLVSGSLHVSITVVTGAAACSVQENLNPVPGGGTATTDWVLYLPNPATFATALAAVVAQSSHLSLEAPPAETGQGAAADTKASFVDLSALQAMRASS